MLKIKISAAGENRIREILLDGFVAYNPLLARGLKPTCFNKSGQINLNCDVGDKDGLPLAGTKLMIKGTYDGATT